MLDIIAAFPAVTVAHVKGPAYRLSMHMAPGGMEELLHGP